MQATTSKQEQGSILRTYSFEYLQYTQRRHLTKVHQQEVHSFQVKVVRIRYTCEHATVQSATNSTVNEKVDCSFIIQEVIAMKIEDQEEASLSS